MTSISDDNYLTSLKILIIGESGVGKSSLMLRFVDDMFDPGGQGVICVYDVGNRPSFDRLEHWIVEVDTYCTKADAVKMLVGNKIDSEGVQCAFEELIEKILQTPGLWQASNSATVKLGYGNDSSSSNMCSC